MRPLLWAVRGFQQLGQAARGASTHDHTVTEVTAAAGPRPVSPQLEGQGRRLFRHLSPLLLHPPLCSQGSGEGTHRIKCRDWWDSGNFSLPGNDTHVAGNILFCLFVGLGMRNFPDQGSNLWPPQWNTQNLNHWTTREVQRNILEGRQNQEERPLALLFLWPPSRPEIWYPHGCSEIISFSLRVQVTQSPLMVFSSFDWGGSATLLPLFPSRRIQSS